MDVSRSGQLAFGFNDRRLDRNSTAQRVADEPVAAGQLPDVVLRRRLQGRQGRLARLCLAGCQEDRAADRADLAGPGPAAGAGEPVHDRRHRQPAPVRHPFNLDYSFRAGIFAGDYSAVAFPNQPGDDRSAKGGDDALGFWTDARNGRGSGGEESFQPGRNPLCEQSDAFATFFNPQRRLTTAAGDPSPFLVTPCPQGSVAPRDGRFDGNPGHRR